MTESGLDLVTGGGGPPRPGRRRAEKRRRPPWGRRIVALVIVLALVGVAYVGVQRAAAWINGPEDFTGQGSGDVTVQIEEGANGQDIANALFEAGVVKSAEAFYRLSLDDARAQAIQPGYYGLRKGMSAEWALRELSDKANRIEGKVTIPEGARVGQIVTAIAKASDITEDELTAALDDPASLGLPDVAGGNPEGYLFPATYVVEPGTTATEILSQMVDKTLAVEKDLDLEARAGALGYSAEEILTVASLLEYEAKLDEDYPKVARVLYNRLDQGMALQLDSTVSYVSQREGDVWTTPEERADPSEYNTYQNVGLPPGPIGSPGETTIEAALNPAKGSWLFFVAVNMETGETKYADTYAEHERNAEEAREYCRNSDIC